MYIRRKLYSRWIKTTRHEFWPTRIFYLPGVIYYLWLCMKNGYLGLLSVANPGMTEAGIYNAPKVAVLNKLAQNNSDYIAKSLSLEEKDRRNWPQISDSFMSAHTLEFPIIVKPQMGQRGLDINLLKSREELINCLMNIPKDALYMLQEFAPGIEYGVHYARFPNRDNGEIFSLGRKDLIYLCGDGVKDLEQLIMEHPRACIMYKMHCSKHRDKLSWVPADGESFKLVAIGTHSCGAIFNDSRDLITPKMSARIDAISKGYPGFFIGRYDVMAASEKDLQEGINFKVVELNSVMGEPPHLYHPGNSLWKGYCDLFAYIKLVVDIATENIRQGNIPLPRKEFINITRESYKQLN